MTQSPRAHRGSTNPRTMTETLTAPSPTLPRAPIRRLRAAAPEPVKRAVLPVKRAFWTSTSPMRLLPRFLIIGAQKAGTSSLYEYLTALPSVPRAVDKEVHYFDLNFERGPAWYRSHFVSRPNAATRRRVHGLELFPCEASPYYLFHPHAPARVRELLPDVRLVVLLRDPVDRAVSHYHHEVAHGRETLPLPEAMDLEEQRLAGEAARLADPAYVSFHHRHHSYLSRGRYAEQIERWLVEFDRERLLILDSARFFAAPQATVQRVCAFVGAPHEPVPAEEAWGARRYAGLDPELEQRLRSHFAPHNERLWELIDDDFGWEDNR